MIRCPYCDFENIEGVDGCDQCGQPLSDLHLRDPQNRVERGLLRDRVSSLTPKPPIMVQSDATVARVLKLMVEQHIGCVFVGENQKAIGVFTDKDAVLRLGSSYREYLDRPIGEFMTRDPEGVTNDAKISFAVRQMDLGGYRHLPMLDAEGRIVGVISVRDILAYLTKKMT